MLWVFGSDGRVARAEQFDVEREAEALARFDEVSAGPAARTSSARFTSTATRALEEIVSAWMDQDWERFLPFYTPDFRGSSRRRILQYELDREEFVAHLRQLADMDSARLVSTVIATRGDRLVLTRLRVDVAEGDVGPSERGGPGGGGGHGPSAAPPGDSRRGRSGGPRRPAGPDDREPGRARRRPGPSTTSTSSTSPRSGTRISSRDDITQPARFPVSPLRSQVEPFHLGQPGGQEGGESNRGGAINSPMIVRE